ncbi:unnamed protein product [Acanthoscelides obtectus]|uniref:Uncharacterized protein n=1 Tax=Acanthoscelides obtectus TaxID=200917 RepID=A0A9P0M1A8_ACAOB|nr:unnamed protein product [Acanthoscelides obtectus]CAK1664310.1 hypothetical protein AOBTE_LOCUS24191 [Acanthoscelides obtectus]
MKDIEAKREARRRKILENADRRLKKITGVEDKNTVAEIDAIAKNLHYNESSVGQEINGILSTHSWSQETGDDLEIRTLYNNITAQENSVPKLEVRVAQKGWHQFYIFILPILLSLGLASCNLLKVDPETIYLNRIFLPLIAFEIINFYGGAQQDSSTSSLIASLLVTNRNNYLSTYFRYTSIFFHIFQDVLIYFFVFIVSHTFMNIIFFPKF